MKKNRKVNDDKPKPVEIDRLMLKAAQSCPAQSGNYANWLPSPQTA